MLAALSMVVATAAIVLQRQEYQKRQSKERELALAIAERDALKSQLDDAERAKSRIEEDFTRARKELMEAQGKAAQASDAQQTLSRSLEERDQQVARLTQEMEQARTESRQATTQLSALQTERDAIRQQLSELQRTKGELESRVSEFSRRPTVELEKVRVTDAQTSPARDPSATSSSQPPSTLAQRASPTAPMVRRLPDGQVVVINREYDFIVMNLGKNHGLSVGQEFHVVRGDAVLGRVKVEKVYDELSAAAILPESRKDEIHEGDAVKALEQASSAADVRAG
jgi:predicted  nucleic acid-binding Zn-ribbon protein